MNKAGGGVDKGEAVCEGNLRVEEEVGVRERKEAEER